jgi:hypothetical protein
MAIGMLLAGEGVTRDTYMQLTETMFGSAPMRAEQSPDGLIVHSAGQSDDGWYVYDIWESEDHVRRFLDTKLGPAMQELGAGDGAPQPQFFPIEVLVEGRALARTG